jgi:hypothetical protein
MPAFITAYLLLLMDCVLQMKLPGNLSGFCHEPETPGVVCNWAYYDFGFSYSWRKEQT